MLNMVKGCKIKDPSVLHEGYERREYGFTANVNAEKLQPLVESFIMLHNELCFLFVEVPTNAKEESALTSDGSATLHKDVYYLDGLSPENAVSLLCTYGELLVHDGMSRFGIGLHSGAGEIMVGKYNVVTVYTDSPQKYSRFFEEQGIFPTNNLKTAWNYFNHASPGKSFLYKHQGKTVYDLVEHLKQYGLYFAERRED